MYISKFTAFNFRSLKHVSVRLENGKNVIVGKNNSGKSNIIKGIDVLIGEKFPSYINFTENDFYTYEHIDQESGEISDKISEHMYLEVELLGKDFDFSLINTIKKKTAFSKIKNVNEIYFKNEQDEVEINFDFFQSLDEIESRNEIEVLEEYSGGRQKKTEWMSPDQLVNFLTASRRLKLFFCKSRCDEEKIGFGLICVDNAGGIWITHFLSKKLRDSLITTTVISALRSQKEELRLVHYSWFGRLMKGLWEANKNNKHPKEEKSYEELVQEKSSNIKDYVDDVFRKETVEIRKLLEGAIAHKAISFRFLNDSTNDLYKNIQLFVNDGIDRPLHEKGTGIQSAIIISLFSLYCNNYHNNSSLLIAEEPELYLHPQARRVISAELEKFLTSSNDQQRQLIISTHSIEYLKNVDPYNIIRVYKESKSNSSVVKQLDSETSLNISNELKRFLWSNNTELFFADKVILVEGGEVYLIPALVDNAKGKKQLLDYENISVTRVNGKGSFLTYIKMLECFDIPFLILGDLDCFKDEVIKISNYFKITEISHQLQQIVQAFSSQAVDYAGINERVKNVDKNYDAQMLQSVMEKFAAKEITSDDEDLTSIINYMHSRYTKGDRRVQIIEQIGELKFKEVLDVLKDYGIFIWSQGDLESYYHDHIKKANLSKDMKALELSYLLEQNPLGELFKHSEEISSLIDKILER